MPNEPEREIEKTLKAYANQRRKDAGAPRGLHPATRRLLRGEALRVHAPEKSNASAWSWWRRGGTLQWAVGFGVIVMMAAGSFFFINRSEKQKPAFQMASAPMSDGAVDRSRSERNEPAHLGPRDAFAPTQSPANRIPAPTAGIIFDDRKAAKEEPVAPPPSPVVMAPAVNSASREKQPVSTNSVSDLALAKDLPAFKPRIALQTTPAPAAPAPAVSMPVSDVTFAETAKSSASETENFAAKKFTRASSPVHASGLVSKNAGTPLVLASFRVETTGDQVRIVDGDGSVYTGRLEQSADQLEEDKISSGSTRRLNSFGGSGGVTPLNHAFRVTGTNLTLKQPVVFTGYFAGNAAPTGTISTTASSPPGISGKIDAPALANKSTSPLRWPGVRISGRAVVGTNQVDISAKAAN